MESIGFGEEKKRVERGKQDPESDNIRVHCYKLLLKKSSLNFFTIKMVDEPINVSLE